MGWITLIGMVVLPFLIGTLRGMEKGIDMTMPSDKRYSNQGAVAGPRAHIWFPYYHTFELLSDTGVYLYGAASAVAAVLFFWPFCAMLAGGCLLIWACSEIGYSWARFKKPLPCYERIYFFQFERLVIGLPLRILQYGRITIGALILISGAVTWGFMI